MRPPGIGGSDAAAACGLDPYRSRVELWLELTGRVEARDESEAMRWGKLLEPLLLAELIERSPYDVDGEAQPVVVAPLPFMRGTIDALAFERETGDYGVVELKTTSVYRASEWSDERVPPAYVVQAQHYLALTDLRYAVVCCLIGGQRFVWRRLDRDEKLIETMLALEGEFWQHVERDDPPAPDGSESAERMIRLLYPEAAGGTVRLAPEHAAKCEEYRKLRAARKRTETRMDAIAQELQLVLGDRAVGLVDGRPVVRWPSITAARFDQARLKAERPEVLAEFTKPSTYRRFTIT